MVHSTNSTLSFLNCLFSGLFVQLIKRSILIFCLSIAGYQPLIAQTLNLGQATFMENQSGATPVLINSANVFVSGNYAYVTGQDYLEILDVTLPGNPIHKGVIWNGDGGAALTTPTSIFVSGSYAYVFNHGADLEIIDISDPSAPKHSGSINVFSNTSYGSSVWVYGNYAFVAGWGAYLAMIDITNPASPVLSKTLLVNAKINSNPNADNAMAITIATVNNNPYAFLVRNTALTIVDIKNPLSPVTLSIGSNQYFTYTTFNKLYDIRVSGYNAFIADFGGNMVHKINIKNPSNPVFINSLTTANTINPISVRPFGGYVYTACKGGTLEVADTTKFIEQGAISNVAPNQYNYNRSMAIVGNSLLMPGYSAGNLNVVDITVPAIPKLLKTVSSGSNGANMSAPRKVVTVNNYAYVASYTNSALEIIDVSNPYDPKHVSQLSITYDSVRSIALAGNYAYLGTKYSVEVVDISNPFYPVWVNRIINGQTLGASTLSLNNVWDVAVTTTGGMTFVLATSLNNNSVEIIDFTIPTTPVFKARLTDGGGTSPYLLQPTYINIYQANNTTLAYILSRNGITKQSVSGQIFASSNTIYSTNGSVFSSIPLNSGIYTATGVFLGTVTQVFTSSLTLSAMSSAYYSGTLYIDNVNAGALQIYDLSNLATGNPVVKGFIKGIGNDLNTINGDYDQVYLKPGYNFGGNRIVVAPQIINNISYLYAYIADTYHKTLDIVDVTNAGSPFLKSKTGPSIGLSGTRGIALFGNYVLLTFFDLDNYSTNYAMGVDAWDASVPGSPVHVPNRNTAYKATFQNGQGILYTPHTISVAGSFAFVGVHGLSQGISMIDLYYPFISSGSSGSPPGFSPSSGVIGSSVTLSGDNFNTFITASINGLNAPVTNVTETSLTITIPPNATNGQIILYTDKEIARTSTDFLVIPLLSPASSINQNGFTASWSDVGARSYYLDVAYDNAFATIIPGYNAINVGNVTSYILSSLTAGTMYYYRVRSSDGTASSGNSNIISVTTIPATPTAKAATAFSQSGFTANWAAVSGVVTNYFLDVASDNAFTNFVPGYNSLSVLNTSTSQVVSGLNPGTYYYRVRSANASGSSPSSATITAVTIPANPIATTASAISATGFTLNWQVSTGATSYSIDLSTDNFATFVSGYNNLSVGSSTSKIISSMASGTSYQYRVRAINSSGTSGNSNVISLLTIPAAPVANPATSITNTSFTANWQLSTGASSYLLEWGTNSGIKGTGYGTYPATSGSVTSYNITGLNPALTYYYRVTAINQTDSSAISNVITLNTIANPPATQSSGINFSNVTSSGLTVSFSPGSGGAYHLVVASLGSPLVAALPLNQTTYTANTAFGSGSAIGNGFVISNGTATSVNVTNLALATTYYFQVFDFNSGSVANTPISGTENYLTITGQNNPASQVTLASSSISQPTNLSLFNITSSGLNGSFTAAQGSPSGYLVLRSSASGTPTPPVNGTTYMTGNTVGSATVVYSGSSLSFNDTGLTPASTYYYSIYSYNGSGSSINYLKTNPLQGQASTFAAPPITQSSSLVFSSVGNNSITVNFTPGSGSSHLLVVCPGGPLNSLPANGNTYTANSQFGQGSPIGLGFVVSTGGSTSVTVSNLSASTTYYFQVFDFNGSGGTENYNTNASLGNPFSQSTISSLPLGQPTNLLFSAQTSTSVNVSFNAAANTPSGYLVLRTVNASPSTPPVSGTAYTIGSSLGNSTVASVGPNISFFDGGLPTATSYTYTVYSFNGVGPTSSYLVSNPLQATVILDATPPVVSFSSSNPVTITDGNTPTINVTATDNVSVDSVQFFYRGIAQPTFNYVLMNAGANGNYSLQVQTTWYDSLGLEYYVIATDENGNSSARNSSYYARLIKPSISLPQLPTGSGLENYRIVSFPYLLNTGNEVTTVYPNVPWNDDTKAGLWWWNPTLSNGAGAYDQYGKSATLKTIDPGKGYWAITSSPFTPQLSNVPAPNYSREKLYQMTLKPGWNEVGNPYPTTISWDDVITFNQNLGAASFGKLNIYDGQAIKEATGTTQLKAFEGGFVKNLTSSDITIQIPFRGQTTGGRIGTGSLPDLTQADWKISLHIDQGDLVNELGGFGMNPQAIAGEDRFDNFNIPLFMNVPELQFTQKEAPGILFSTDVINPMPTYTWTFTPQGVAGKETRLVWDSKIISDSEHPLFLLDEDNLNVVNMTEVNTYLFTLSSASRFRAYYGKNALDEISSEGVLIGKPYPNPLLPDSKVNIKLSLPSTEVEYAVDAQVFTMQGELIYSSTQNLSSGIKNIQMDFNANLSSGLYIYKLIVLSSASQKIVTGKIIKP